ncbi:hypothetical protein ACKKBG_A07695 [Auxenochlorella protothecoides x Auxenochlorella symbiontica]|uniref:Uncharacterized protein n=1 Tax=Auxenochlorella protothecoides TaxID=3075 RepID=A0A087SRZ7_AUXPR|nr:hypothetical protein F751_5729 [Auxenochlorella protothecoides]KFM28501.1 hypothetical protein F751_5729 [Auxenochlorella protothecoides]RMZ55532.1 hypothetical protein APUTEX25_000115 [Auxenochlorella protothecoides]|eukprot:RMZ55532.1 hypothetical protein APUTEX25_000115 [Auxenochlorella protothecoides]
MAFLQRLMNYWLNEVLVNTLANSRTFQKFAVRSSASVEELAKKTAEHKERIAGQGGDFMKVFREEMTKGLSDLQKKGGKL